MLLALLVASLLLQLQLCCAGGGEEGTRYLLYSVNPGEGFNLRRDVHMRAATLVHKLRSHGDNWVLVLPPWQRMYHWRSPSNQHSFVEWGQFFDLESLNEYVPSIEFTDYLQWNGDVIDEVVFLQDFDGPFSSEQWGTIEVTTCHKTALLRYSGIRDGEIDVKVFQKENVRIKSLRCLSIMGTISLLQPYLQNTTHNSFFIEHFENVVHEHFAGEQYWRARRSMVYAAHLREAGAAFMREKLAYDRGRGVGREPAKEGGGDYLAVHMRRQDYVSSHSKNIPSLEGAAHQINIIKTENNISTVFLATDAPIDERRVIEERVEGVVWYTPTEDELHNYGDGGVAIIDQWIAAHAKYFIGTTHSTFSYRIREDRQFLGFSYDSSGHDLCGPAHNELDPNSCDKPTHWKMVDLPPWPQTDSPLSRSDQNHHSEL